MARCRLVCKRKRNTTYRATQYSSPHAYAPASTLPRHAMLEQHIDVIVRHDGKLEVVPFEIQLDFGSFKEKCGEKVAFPNGNLWNAYCGRFDGAGAESKKTFCRSIVPIPPS